MRKDFQLAIILAVAAIPAGLMIAVAPEYLHLTGVAQAATFWGCLALTVFLIAAAVIIALRGESHSPVRGHRERMTAIAGMAIFGMAFVACAIWFYASREKSLPGFGTYAYIRLYDTPELRRRVIFNFVASSGASIKFFLSPSGRFNFTVFDTHAEPYSLEIPIGSEGIPIDRYIYLFCEVGITAKETILRVTVDHKEVGYRSLPFQVNVGKMDWKQGAIGADVEGKNNAPFKIAELGLFKTTLTEDQKEKLIKNFDQYRKNIGFDPN